MDDVKVSTVSFTGYKAFKSPQSIDIKPLTILFGYNNSGKSAAIRLMPMLAASFSENKRQTLIKSYLDYTSPCLRGAAFNNLSHAAGNKMSFGLEWEDGESINFDLTQVGEDEESISAITIQELNKTVLESFDYQISDDFEPEELRYQLKEKKLETVLLDNFTLRSDDSENPIVHKSLDRKLKEFSRSVFWLNSIRTQPPREFAVNSSILAGIKYDGSGTAETIWKMSRVKSPALDDINEWLVETCGRAIDINLLSQSSSNDKTVCKLETISVNDTASNSSIRIPILDSGEGISQALPVVTLCAQAATGELGINPIIMLEQPELHLHPRAVVTLANFLVKCIKKNKRASFIIETHSESLLLAIQTALAAGDLSLDDLCTYWVSKGASEEGSLLRKVEFDESGYILKNFPDEVFQEIYEQAKTLMDVRDNNKGE
ncbi:AAA family ATPase [Pseudomonas sp.]|uniref:AAA family ATPase n=1 Tax=unclassified Pseudomonas TaxID=196821 RepID=UPI0019B32043|nr:AAA family ATPase [Pseudomonas sp.]MBC6625149.1 AAA family ATPase [Pseudomonas sp.]MBP6953081.1 AAA family ATPase [Pseudomonas sp.]